MNPRILIRSLERSDVRDGFDCGDPALDVFIRQYAGQNQWRHHIAVTYVAVEDSSRLVLGYVTVAAGGIQNDDATAGGVRDFGYSQVPMLRVARMAVDRRLQGLGLGEQLLRFALSVAVRQSELTGCVGVLVDAKPEAREFYGQYGFRPLNAGRGRLAIRPRQDVLYLGTREVKAALE